jgi:hypothetical protein
MKQVLFDRRLERMIGNFINAFRDNSHAIGKDFQAFLAGDEWQDNAFLVKLIRPCQCETYTLERRALLDDAKTALDNGVLSNRLCINYPQRFQKDVPKGV